MDVNLSGIIAPAFFEPHHEIKEDEYSEYWFKGGRGSTKSTFVSIEIILGMINDPVANAVVLRRYQNELRNTVYGQFVWTITKMGIEHLFNFNVSPMQITYIATGQKIVFQGADNPRKLKSINIGKGIIKYLWSEEVDQFASYDEIRNIMQSVFRGADAKRIAFFSYNPPKSGRSWVNQAVKIPKPGKRVHHSDFTQVPPEWLGESFIKEAEHIKKVNDSAYRHEYLGEEVGTGLEVFNNVTIREITDDEIGVFPNIRQGLDWGYAVDPVEFLRMDYDRTRRRLHIFDELSGIGVSNRVLHERIGPRARVLTIADSAEPKSIDEMKSYDMEIEGAKKGPGSIEFGIKFLQDIEQIIIDPVRCPLAAREFVNYALEMDRNGIVKSRYPDKNNHAIDTVRYALQDDMVNEDVPDVDEWSFH